MRSTESRPFPHLEVPTMSTTHALPGTPSPSARRPSVGDVARAAYLVAKYVQQGPFRLSSARRMVEAVFHLIGPRVEREYATYAATELGQRRIAERSDLAALLDDHARLAQMPEGSLGRRYLDFFAGGMMGETGQDADVVKGATGFVELLRIGDAARKMGWPEEYVWFVERLTLTHDLTHVFTGYGTDNAGEFANIAYTCTHLRVLPLVPVVAASFLLAPDVGRVRWARYLLGAMRRGRTQKRSLVELDYESLLEMQIEDVVAHIGLEPFDAVHPDGRIDDELGFTNLNAQAMLAT